MVLIAHQIQQRRMRLAGHAFRRPEEPASHMFRSTPSICILLRKALDDKHVITHY